MNKNIARRRLLADDSGVSLVEIVVAMLVLGILSLALLPLLIQGIRQSAANSTLATATQLVSEQMQLAQGRGPVCADVFTLNAVTELDDSRGVPLRITTTVEPCEAAVGTVRVESQVARIDGDAPEVLATSATLVLLED